MVADYGRVAVLLGGRSPERNISLSGGESVYKSLYDSGVSVDKVDTGKEFINDLYEGDYDRAFVLLHGAGGEDGRIQGLLDSMDMPYTGSGVLASALCMDKCLCKKVWAECDLPVPDHVEIPPDDADQALAAVEERLGMPLMVKPGRGGSSQGMSKVEHPDELRKAWEQARIYDRHVFVEQWVEGAEYTVPILQDRVLPIIKLETSQPFYDYYAKYEANDTRYICPSGLDVGQESHIGVIALKAFRAVHASGWGRVDLIIDKDGMPQLLEINTVPGMTKGHSLVPMAARQTGMSYDDLVQAILQTSMIDAGDGDLPDGGSDER